ncbi:MAG: acyl-CoA dehydrogenase [Gammaproteobacteria bacterium]|nr:MAG: acyl-CoA dehydrogenase [Gammaproteobacteria bacterium]
MALVLTEEQELLRDSARGFVADQWNIDRLRKLRSMSSGRGHDEDLWKQMAELGWTGIPFAEEYGGLGLGYAELGVVLEELGRGLVVAPFLSSIVLAGSAVALGGNDAQRKSLLPGVCDGTRLLALAYQESPRHDPYAIATAARLDGDDYLLSGRKVLVLDGESADLLVVAARTGGSTGDRDGLTLFLVASDVPGLTLKRNVLLDSRCAVNIELDNVRVESNSVLGAPGTGADVLDEVFARAAVALSAEMLGGIQESFDRTVEYLKERDQFGVKIGTFQGLKHRAARWFCEVELTRSIVMDALRAIDEQREQQAMLASACKARASDTYRLCGKEGIQMHGGMGVTDEADIGFFMKRARVSELLLGDSTYHRNRFAELGGY